MSIAVQLLDGDGAILSIANVDDAFWNGNSDNATSYASGKGLGVYAAAYPPDAGTAERNINTWGDWTQWVDGNQFDVKKPLAAPSGKLAAVGLLVALLGLTLAISATKRR